METEPSTRRRLRGSARPVLVAAVPVGLVVLASAASVARLPVLVILVVGLVTLRGDPVGRWAWAAPIGVAVNLSWGLLAAPEAAADGSDCASPFSAPATWRLGESLLVLAWIGILARWLPSTRGDLGLRRPARPVLVVAGAGALLVAPIALAVGPTLAAPIFGNVAIRIDRPGALVPALAFALSNGAMEELAYRGAFLGWLARALRATAVPGPVLWAVAGQALVFGLAHGIGPEFVGSPLPVVGAMVAGGILAGVVVRRTGSLVLPIALHIALDVPLYYYWACRLS